MIIVLGVLSLFQLIFVPGLLLTRLLKIRGFWENLLLSIALSPIINYLFVFITSVLNIYNQLVILIFFTIEIILLVYLLFPLLNRNFQQTINNNSIRMFLDDFLHINVEKKGWKKKISNTIYILFFLCALLSLFYYVYKYGTQTSSVFTVWDTVVSWDRWAIDWYNSNLPTLTYHYPQLIPANWSITYTFMGDSRIKFFAKDFMGYIEIFIVFSVFVIGIVKRKLGYFLGVILAAWLQIELGSRGTGLVDSAVAFWGLMAIICLILADNNFQNEKIILIGAVIAAGAAITKQAGLWIVIVYPILVLLQNRKSSKKELFSLLGIILMIDLIVVAPWYTYKQYQVIMGLDVSEIGYVTSHSLIGDDYIGAILSAFRLLRAYFGYSSLPLIFVGLLLLFSYKDHLIGKIVNFIIIPFTLIWAVYFSYDARNLNFVVPMTGLASGIGLQSIIEANYEPLLRRINNGFRKLTHNFQKIRLVYLLPFVLLIFLLPFKYSNSYMISKSIKLQKTIGDPQINSSLYEYFSKNGFDGKILTDYQFLGFLPDLSSYYLYGYPGNEDFEKLFKQPDVGYALISKNNCSAEFLAEIDQLIRSNKIKIISTSDSLILSDTYYLVTTCHGSC